MRSTLWQRIPARNLETMRKDQVRQDTAYGRQRGRIKRLAHRYRQGYITAKGIAQTDREAVHVYLLEHPRTRERQTPDGAVLALMEFRI